MGLRRAPETRGHGWAGVANLARTSSANRQDVDRHRQRRNEGEPSKRKVAGPHQLQRNPKPLGQHEAGKKPGGKWVNHVGTPPRAMKRRYQIGGTCAADICDILTVRFWRTAGRGQAQKEAGAWLG